MELRTPIRTGFVAAVPTAALASTAKNADLGKTVLVNRKGRRSSGRLRRGRVETGGYG